MKERDCLTVTPGEPLTDWQKAGLDFVAYRHGGRDVILAIDLTGSVNFNDEGRTRLGQIIQDSLQSGDSVYVVPFASTINPLPEPILIRGKEDIEQVLKAIPWQSNPDARNTDIQRAELSVYQGLAILNQCRFTDHQPIKPQSVVWITDAPLSTTAGIISEQWIETPADSPFRAKDSPESLDRQGWLKAFKLEKQGKDLPATVRTRSITTDSGKSYFLSVADISPTVQEFCSPAPGGKENCRVNAYLLDQLWLPVSGILLMGIMAIIASFLGIRHTVRRRTPWTLIVKLDSDPDEMQKYTLKTSEKISIGGEGVKSIECKGEEIRAYLERRGNQLFLRPTQQTPIFYRGNEVRQEVKIDNHSINLNCPENNQDFELQIQIDKK